MPVHPGSNQRTVVALLAVLYCIVYSFNLETDCVRCFFLGFFWTFGSSCMSRSQADLITNLNNLTANTVQHLSPQIDIKHYTSLAVVQFVWIDAY